MLVVQVGITAAKCQAIVSPYNRTHKQIDTMIELFHHLGKNTELLNILLSKSGHVGFNDVKEFIHHQNDALKKTGAGTPVHIPVELVYFNAQILFITIHDIITGRKNG